MLTESVNGYVLSALVFLLGGLASVLAGKWLSIGRVTAVLLYCWHTLFAIGYWFFILSTGGDAIVYFQRAQIEAVSLKTGTEFVVWFTSYPTDWGFSFLATSLVYNIIGAIGLVVLFASLREETTSTRGTNSGLIVSLLLVLIPSLSFWSSAIGKDSIAFLAVTLFTWASLQLQKRFKALVIGVLLMMSVRPHMAVLMIMCVGAGALIQQRLGGAMRMGFGLAAAAAAAVAVPLAILYVRVDQFTDLTSYVDTRQTKTNEGGSGIDIGGMNPVARVAGYLYRPLPYEASGPTQLASSLENIGLIVLTVVCMVLMFRAGYLRILRQYPIIALYSVGGLIILSQVTGNLGIAARQKWMVIPPVLLMGAAAWRFIRDERRTPTPRAAYGHAL